MSINNMPYQQYQQPDAQVDPYHGGYGKAPRRSSGKASNSRSYPRGLGLDFRKLAGLTLVSYVDNFDVNIRADAPPSELAVAVARHFEQLDVEEEECIGSFLTRLEGSNLDEDVIPPIPPPMAPPPRSDHIRSSLRKRQRQKRAARHGEQIAAKVTRTDENGSWILASVQRFYADTETYDVQDEDDTTKLIRLPWSHVMRLSTGAEGYFKKGADCMAIFPETTSFYKAKVSKDPVWSLEHNPSQNSSMVASAAGLHPNTSLGATPIVKEIVVKFEDDEDADNKTPHRRVPARYVIPVPSKYFYDEMDDIDMTPPPKAVTGGMPSSTAGP